MELSDEFIHDLVTSQPIPLKLVDAIARAPLLDGLHDTPNRTHLGRRWGVPTLEHERLTVKLEDVLWATCHGLTVNQTAGRLFYSPHTIRDMRKALLAIFHARNAPHMAALAVATGHVDMLDSP